MASVLIVDDVRDYCEELAIALNRERHEVRIATTEGEAIEQARLFHPEVLITDWLLEDGVQGTEIVKSLRIIYPGLQTILMSGVSSERELASSDLEIFRFISKPFLLDEIRAAVREAAATKREKIASPQIGYLETDSSSKIIYANRRIRELWSELGSAEFPDNLSQLFGAETSILECFSGWFETARPNAKPWHVRARRIEAQSRNLYFVVDNEHANFKNDPYLQKVLRSAADGSGKV